MRDDEFERLYAAEAQGLFGFLAYRTGDRGLAEDLLADTFERALRSRRRFDRRRGSEKTWLYAIAVNLLTDTQRREASERRALERAGAPAGVGGAEPAAPDVVGRLAERDRVAHALRTLGDDERTAVALRYGADLSLKEVARVAGISRAAAEQRVYRGLGKLRDELGPQ